MKKICKCLVVIVLVLCIGCNSIIENSTEESSVQIETSSEPSKVESVEESSAENGEPVLEIVEGTYPVRSFQINEDEYFKEEDSFMKWERSDEANLEVSKEGNTELFSELKLDQIELQEEDILALVGSNDEYLAVKFYLNKEENIGGIRLYKIEDQLLGDYWDFAPSEGYTVQNIALTENYLYWGETYTYMESNPHWVLKGIDLEEKEVRIILTSEDCATNASACASAAGDRLVTILPRVEDEFATVCGYSWKEDRWETYYTINSFVHPFMRLHSCSNEIYSYDYDGEAWKGIIYDIESGERKALTLKLKYDMEYPMYCEFVGDWALYTSSFGMLYAQNYITGELRYIAPYAFASCCLADHYVIFTRNGEAVIYDLESGEYIEQEIGADEIIRFIYSVNRNHVDVLKKPSADSGYVVFRFSVKPD